MHDILQKHFWWITGFMKIPIPEFFKTGTTEYEIISHFKNRWGTQDTISLLNELSDKHGDLAGQVVEKFLEINVLKEWKEVGKKEAHPGSEIPDFIRVLWEPLKKEGFEFSIEEEDNKYKLCIKKCPISELAEETGLHKWLYHLACSTDFSNIKGFSPKVGFTRTKTLIQGDDHCNHCYYYV